MALNFGDHQGFGGLNQLGLALEDMAAHNSNNGQASGYGPNGAPIAAAGVVAGVYPGTGGLHQNGVNSVGVGSNSAAGGQQQQPPTPPPPSSWAAKVRAGLGSDGSPLLGSSGGVGMGGVGGTGLGSIGDISSAVDMDPTGAGLRFGQLAGSVDGIGPGPVHGLSMEAGGIPASTGRGPSSTMPLGGGIPQTGIGGGGVKGGIGSVGAVGMGLGVGLGGGGGEVGASSRVAQHDTSVLQQQQQAQVSLPRQRSGGAGARGVDTGMVGQNGSGGPGNSSGITAAGGEGSGALTQDFRGLNLGGRGSGSAGAAGGAGSTGVGIGFDASKDDLLGDFPCVRLRGLAADTSVKDILDFFVGLGPVLDIVLEGGAADGEVGAITLFGNLMDYHGALQRYSLQIKGRYIEVAPAVRSDYYAAVINRSTGGGRASADSRLSMTPPAAAVAAAAGRGNAGHLGRTGSRNGPGREAELSTGTGAAPLAQSQGPGSSGTLASGSQGPAAAATGAVAGVGHAGAAGVASPVGVPGAQSAASMPAQSSGGLAGSGGHAGGGGLGMRKGIKVPMSAGAASKAKGGGMGPTGDGKGAVIRMRGLPYRASKSEVMGFFKGCSIPEEGIAFVTRADGRVTGEAYVRFASREDAKMGIRKDREMMGSRYIELFTSSPEEMNRYTSSKR